MSLSDIEWKILAYIIDKKINDDSIPWNRTITRIYQIIRNICRKKFYEDNDVTLDTYLDEQFAKTAKRRIVYADTYTIDEHDIFI